MRQLTTEERYQIFIDRYVGVGELEKNDGSGETLKGKWTMKGFLYRKRHNESVSHTNKISHSEVWLDKWRIPKYDITIGEAFNQQLLNENIDPEEVEKFISHYDKRKGEIVTVVTMNDGSNHIISNETVWYASRKNKKW